MVSPANKETGLRENEGLWKQLVFERVNAILGGIAVRTVYERQKFLNEGGAIEDMEAVLDDMTDELF